MFRLSAVNWGNRDGATDRRRFPWSAIRQRPPSPDLSVPRSVDRAIDCWCHGVTHLLSALEPEAALALMARTVVDLVDRNAGSPAPSRTV